MEEDGTVGKPSNGQKGRYIRDVLAVLAAASVAAYLGLRALNNGDRDGYLLLAAATSGLYYILYRVFKYIKLYTKWM